jgi:hypothetical protein
LSLAFAASLRRQLFKERPQELLSLSGQPSSGFGVQPIPDPTQFEEILVIGAVRLPRLWLTGVQELN